MGRASKFKETLVEVTAGPVLLEGMLTIPEGAKGIVLFAHGSGSSRHSPRNQYVASALNEGRLATLLVDLLTTEEENIDLETRHLRFDIPLLAERLSAATDWLQEKPETHPLKIGYFGSSTGAAAALVSAAEKGKIVGAVVSRGGRPDLAGAALAMVVSPTLLIVGGHDYGVIELNQHAYDLIKAEKKLEIVPGATHLFEESGTLEEVAHLARAWFVKNLT
jgi:dienelactone hydrolase